MPDAIQLLSAAATGSVFGAIVSRLGSTWQRLAFLLTMLWMLQSLPQNIYRTITVTGDLDEMFTVGLVRLTFGFTACLVVWLVNRRAR